MARIPMVTRSFKVTKVNVLCLDVIKAEPFNQLVVLPTTYKDTDKLMKAVRKEVDNDNVKAVHIVDTTVEDVMYGMTEQEFINHARLLDPTTRKSIENETNNEAENN